MEFEPEAIKELLPESSVMSYEEAVQKLSTFCQEKIATDFRGFFQLMYRIDVKESLLNDAFQSLKGEDLYQELGRIILNRLILKYKFRTGNF